MMRARLRKLSSDSRGEFRLHLSAAERRQISSIDEIWPAMRAYLRTLESSSVESREESRRNLAAVERRPISSIEEIWPVMRAFFKEALQSILILANSIGSKKRKAPEKAAAAARSGPGAAARRKQDTRVYVRT